MSENNQHIVLAIRELLATLLNSSKDKVDPPDTIDDPLDAIMIYGSAMVLASIVCEYTKSPEDAAILTGVTQLCDAYKSQLMAKSYYGIEKLLRKEINTSMTEAANEDNINAALSLIELSGAARVLYTMTGDSSDYEMAESIKSLAELRLMQAKDAGIVNSKVQLK